MAEGKFLAFYSISFAILLHNLVEAHIFRKLSNRPRFLVWLHFRVLRLRIAQNLNLTFINLAGNFVCSRLGKTGNALSKKLPQKLGAMSEVEALLSEVAVGGLTAVEEAGVPKQQQQMTTTDECEVEHLNSSFEGNL